MPEDKELMEAKGAKLLPDDIENARKVLSDWCSNHGKNFRMSIPYQATDSDAVMGRVIDAALRTTQLEKALRDARSVILDAECDCQKVQCNRCEAIASINAVLGE